MRLKHLKRKPDSVQDYSKFVPATLTVEESRLYIIHIARDESARYIVLTNINMRDFEMPLFPVKEYLRPTVDRWREKLLVYR